MARPQRTPPRDRLTKGEWPDGTTADPSAERAQRLARNLRSERQRQGLTVHQVAERCAVAVGTVSRIENGQSWPDTDVIARLEVGLGVALWPPYDGTANGQG